MMIRLYLTTWWRVRLQDCFVPAPGGQATTIVGTVSPVPSDTEKTVHSLSHLCLVKVCCLLRRPFGRTARNGPTGVP